jgi:hypothetical protein
LLAIPRSRLSFPTGRACCHRSASSSITWRQSSRKRSGCRSRLGRSVYVRGGGGPLPSGPAWREDLVTTSSGPGARTVICSPTTSSGAGPVAGLTANASGMEIPLFCFGVCRNGRRIRQRPPMRRVPVGWECVNCRGKERSLMVKRPTPKIIALTARAWLVLKVTLDCRQSVSPWVIPSLSSSACGSK